MKKTFFISLIIAIVMIGSLTALNLALPTVFAITFIFTFLIIFMPQLYYMYFSKDVNKIERFMQNNIKQPLIALYYGVANEDDQLVSESIEKVLKKYKKPHHKAIFKTIHSLYKKDFSEIKKYVSDIKPLPYQYYYVGVNAINERNFSKAEEIVGKIEIACMKYELKAALERESGCHEKAVS
ncbi:hypothetical protein [Lederbergia citri]|uniref:Uncharacterized protein n=1 Tax=Lederbergia citri TaxID=2833580 RepID=A0A942YH70_9BACI|nr:hypothetical protein [Lederbergia citri]MBS4195469.1 hypothetical protein [Lederbergia citri]